MQMNDYEIMCMSLEKAKRCGCSACKTDNEYICAYNTVKAYVGTDKTKLYKLKGETMKSDFGLFSSEIFAGVSILISIVTLLYTVFSQYVGVDENITLLYGAIIILGVIGAFIYMIYVRKKFTCILHWGGYIQVAIEKIEEEK